MNTSVVETSAPQTVSIETLAFRSSEALVSISWSRLLWIAALTPLVLLVHGYHPYSDDAGGIYVAGIEKMMDPSLFGADSGFVLAHTRFSIFSHIFAAALKLSHVPLDIGLFLAYLASIFLFLLGCKTLAEKMFAPARLQWGATALAGALFTIPVAATSLWLMDPYVTARSFSTPLSLFALAACVEKKWTRCALWLALTATMHPLMAAYLAIFLLTCFLVQARRWRLLGALCVTAFLATAALYAMDARTVVTDAYREAVLSRTYFFLANWHWYELLGVAMPLLLMLAAVRFTRRGGAVSNLCIACIVSGSMAVLCSACFVHTDKSYLLARIQLLRTFQVIYLVGALLLGGFLARFRAGVAAVLLACAPMYYAQALCYTASAHVEWPMAAPENSWQQAFLWIRAYTPQDAVFAMDAEYGKSPGEDTQGFRSIAERSSLADGLKDGGVVSLFPALAPQWKKEHDLQLNLNRIDDHERIARLRPAGVSWLVLDANVVTAFACPYRNAAVQVCRLPLN